MEKHVSPFIFENEHVVRMIDIGGEPWFVAIDVCRALDLQNTARSVDRLDDDEKGVHSMNTLGGMQEMTIISEPGVYRLVFSSRKPIAERFKRWLAHEVIPAIRRTGGYLGDAEAAMPAPVERRAFPDWPTEELRAKKGVVDMYRQLYGIMSAQWISPQIGFPVPPAETIERGREMPLFAMPRADQ